MPTFEYRAKDRSGRTVDGSIDAADARTAAGKIREMGYFPLDLKEHAAPRPQRERSAESIIAPIWSGVSVGALTVFFRQLATMLQAGMMLSEALESLGSRRGMGGLPRIAHSAAERVRAGGPFSDVLARYPHTFSSVQVGLVRVGETGGMLDSMVDRIAQYLEREVELRQKFARATFYPKLLVLAFVAFLVFFPYLPSIVNQGWPAVWAAVRTRLVPIIIVVAVVYIVIKLLLLVPPIRLGWDRFKLSVPVLGAVVRKMAMARFGGGLSVMYSAGLPIAQAVEVSAEAAGNEVIRRSILSAAPEIRSGGQITEALRRAGGVPELVLGMLATGERTGNLSQVLDKAGEYYESEAATTLEKSGYLLFVLLILAIGIVIGAQVIMFWGGFYGGLGVGG